MSEATTAAAPAPMARAPMPRLAPLRPLQSNSTASSLQPLKPVSLFKQPLAAPSAPAASSTAAPPSDESNVQELLQLVRQRYPDEPKATAAAAPAIPLADATAASASFSEAASSAQVDKLAVLMSLFKSRGIEPPPLPMFEKFDSFDDEEPTAATDAPAQAEKQVANGHAQESQGTAVDATAASKPNEWQEPTTAIAAASAATDRSAAEVAQLTALFQQARNKVTKLCRLYQSGILKGAGATQAVEKLSALIRTYYAFIQHSKTHPHISAVGAADPAIAADVACSSLQQLADRTYAQCKS